MAKGGGARGSGGGRRVGARLGALEKAAGRKAAVAYCEALAVRILERVAAGELVYSICREAGMPTGVSVARWARERADFGAALAEARASAGAAKRGPAFTYCEEVGAAIYERLCEGESLTAIGRDPTMPSLSTIFYWRRRFSGFDELIEMGKRVQAERFCDLGWEMAEAATPETAYLTHVRLGQLRWMAGVMAPRAFRLKLVEPEERAQETQVLFRRFAIERDAASGEARVVSYLPNPETGEVEREEVARRGGSAP